MLKKSLFAAFLSVSFMVGITACGEKPAENETTDAAQTETTQEEVGNEEGAKETENAEVAYYCPMECEGEKTYAEATTCPVCGMDLVEKQ